MSFKYCLFLVLTHLINVQIGFAQYPDAKRTSHWLFGYRAGFYFSNGIILNDSSANLYTYESCSSMSDTIGNLLFYTDGDTIWNTFYQPMPNGTGLAGCGNLGSSANAGIIVPKPKSNNLFFVITTDCAENFQNSSGLRYSIVDINLDSGRGDVISKNILLDSLAIEGVAVTKHCDGERYWIVSHEKASNNFKTFLLDSNGFSLNPVISSTGLTFIDIVSFFRFSNSGNKLAVASGNTAGADQLFDFDNSTGEVCGGILIKGILGDGYSPIFSPDDTKLYYVLGGSYLYQYDLSLGYDSATISNSWNIVEYNPDNSTFGAMQLGVDNKIYIASKFHDSISTMEFPNLYGSACMVNTYSIYLNGGISTLGLPSFAQSLFSDSIVCQSCATGFEEPEFKDDILIYPNPSEGRIQVVVKNDFIRKIDVYNNLGCQIKSVQNEVQNGVLEINLNHFSEGIYFLNIFLKTNRINKLITILNKF